MTIGNKIKQLRIKSGLTQEQLAKKIGVSPQSISKWETELTMPDITLLPLLSSEFGVTIDELFDITTEVKLKRIEQKLDIEESLSREDFYEYENYLKNLLNEYSNKGQILSLLAHLYHHRIESDSKIVSKYAKEAIKLSPDKKDCQWLLTKSEGATIWDWNIDNHHEVINFYKEIIEKDTISPKTSLPYLYLIDNLIADRRVEEAKKYLDEYKELPSSKETLVIVYNAYIAMAEYNIEKANEIMDNAFKKYSDNTIFLFEYAQYLARNCYYDKAIEIYELCWNHESYKKPRYTDALDAIAIIYEIQNNYHDAIKTYNRLKECLIDEWGYNDDDYIVIEVNKKIQNIQDKYL